MNIINPQRGKKVVIAYQAENNRTQVRFDLSDIVREFPGGTAVLVIRRRGDMDPVPAAQTEMDGSTLVWTVTAWECAIRGYLYAQVVYSVGDVVAKTKIYRLDVAESMTVSGAEPEEWADLVGQLVTAAAGVNTAIEAAEAQLRQYVADAEAAQTAAAGSATAAAEARTDAQTARTGAENAQTAAEAAQRAAEEAVGQYDDMTATATGLAAGEEPTAVIDHTGDHPVLRLGIPAGERGADGAQGPQGERGPAGPAGPKGDPGEAADVIDDTVTATDKTFSSSKLEQQREELLSAINGKLTAPSTAGTSGQVLTSDGQGGQSWQTLDAPVTVTGTTPTITAMPGVRYICGQVDTLTIVAPESGCIDITFESGSTPTVLTVTPPTGMTMKWANGFDPTSLDADTTYEINILDGCLGVAGSWT